MLVLKEPFQTLWKNKDPFEEVEKISGDVMRALESRRTLRFDANGASYYLKLHHGTKIKEIIKSLIRLRLPILGADREWYAIHRLAKHGIDTMEGVAFGEENGNPFSKTSFIITKDLSPACNVRNFILSYHPSPTVKRLIIRRVAKMVRGMHDCGINHRDCYLVHYLIQMPFDPQKGQEEALKISVIDLHRAQLRNKVPTRWRDKDLIGLLFSAREIKEISVRDIFRFLKVYFQMPLPEILEREASLIASAHSRVVRMERHQENLKKKRHL